MFHAAGRGNPSGGFALPEAWRSNAAVLTPEFYQGGQIPRPGVSNSTLSLAPLRSMRRIRVVLSLA